MTSSDIVISNECASHVSVPLAFMVENHCLKFSSISTVANGFWRRYTETDESIERRGGDDNGAYLSVNFDGYYDLYIYEGEDRIKCTSKDIVSDIGENNIYDMTSSEWETCIYTDTSQVANVNTDFSCGCFQDESLSGGEIAGAIIGAIVGVCILVILGVMIFKCRKKKASAVTAGENVG